MRAAKYGFITTDPAGDTYAVEFESEFSDRIISACGPLGWREMRRSPDPSEYHLDTCNAAWLNGINWRPVAARSPLR